MVSATPLGLWLSARAIHPPNPTRSSTGREPPPRAISGLAFVVGAVGGIYGIGGGSILGPILVGRGIPITRVAPAALASTPSPRPPPTACSPGHPWRHRPNWVIGISCGLGGLLGRYAGARLRPHLPDRGLRPPQTSTPVNGPRWEGPVPVAVGRPPSFRPPSPSATTRQSCRPVSAAKARPAGGGPAPAANRRPCIPDVSDPFSHQRLDERAVAGWQVSESDSVGHQNLGLAIEFGLSVLDVSLRSLDGFGGLSYRFVRPDESRVNPCDHLNQRRIRRVLRRPAGTGILARRLNVIIGLSGGSSSLRRSHACFR